MAERIIRVFPRRTNMTPQDDYAFVGDPPMMRPEAEEVHISCTFTWDISEAKRLYEAWGQYYPVKIGGPAFSSPCNGFTVGLYVRPGVTFTSRGCNNHCPWCLVPQREGRLRELPIQEGNTIQDNNILQCSRDHIAKVIDMLRSQHQICFSGGLEARLLTDSIADDLRSLSIRHLFLAADTKKAIRPLARAKDKLRGFNRNQLRCYVLIGFNGETIGMAQERLEDVWALGFMPFAQLYQPSESHIRYSKEWQDLARIWTRPAISKAFMTGDSNG